jgi:hypothetical protein
MNDKEPTWAVFDDPNEAKNVCLCISYKGRDTVFSLPRDDMYKLGEALVEFTHKGIALPRTVCRRGQGDI